VSEDLDAFLFEFNILCCSMDYSIDAQKLNYSLLLSRKQPYVGSWVWRKITLGHGKK
jgi:hypothetical protein